MISIVIPVYNVEQYIEKCLQSIINQNYRDFEVILVNDGTKDQSIEIAKNCLDCSDINWRVVNKENGGLASARNAGLKESVGEYVTFIDSDDVITNDFLEVLIGLLKEDCDFSFCDFRFVKSQEIQNDPNDKHYKLTRDELLQSFLKRSIGFVVPSMLFRRGFLIENGLLFDENIRFSEDQLFIWNVIIHSTKSNYSFKKMYGYFVRESSIMTSSSYEKVSKSHEEFKNEINRIFFNYPEYKTTKDLIIPRWQLGALYTSARMLDRNDFNKLYDQMEGKTILKRLKGIGEVKAYLLGTVCSLSKDLLYSLCQRMNLNG